MAASEPAQQYVVFDAERLVGEQIQVPLTPAAIDNFLWPRLEATQEPIAHEDYTVESVPLVEFVPGDREMTERPPFKPQEVFSVTSPDEGAAGRFRNAVETLISDGGDQSPISQLGVNVPIAASDFS